MTIKFTNNAATLISTSSLADDATSVAVDDGSVFPSLSAGEFFYATLIRADSSTTREIVKVTARSGNTLTIVRAQDNTSATTFSADDHIELRVVAATLESLKAADEITTGDAAVSLATTTGNITIDAQANDADVIIKVDDAGSSVTAVTFDGSDEGNAIFVNDIQLKSDGALLEFGADLDTTLTHTDGTGLTLNSTNKLTFGDAASFVQQSGDGVLRIDGEATIDLNASTAVTVSNDLKLDSDSAVLGFGADNDVTLTHVADTGVTLSAGDNATVLQLDSNDSGASSGPKILLNRTSDSPADDDYTGTIIFQGENDNNEQFKTAQLSSQAKDVSDGTEDSELQLATIINGTLTNGVVLTSNGVSMPTQPAWGARGTGSVTMSGSSSYVVAANSVEVVDIGGNYNTSTYQFTAPMDGTYYVAMSFCPTTLPGVTGPAQWLYKNGSAVKELGINYSSDRFETTTGVYILSLDAGDYIEQRMVNYNNTTFVLDRSRGFFGGFLIG